MVMKGMPGKKAQNYFGGGVGGVAGIFYTNLQVTPSSFLADIRLFLICRGNSRLSFLGFWFRQLG